MNPQLKELEKDIMEIGKELVQLRVENKQLKERVAHLEAMNMALVQRPVYQQPNPSTPYQPYPPPTWPSPIPWPNTNPNWTSTTTTEAKEEK